MLAVPILALSKRIETLLGSQQPRTKVESRIKMLAGMLEENAAREIIWKCQESQLQLQEMTT